MLFLCKDTELQTVANAIRSKGGTSASLSFPTGMKNAIDAIKATPYFDTVNVQVTLSSPITVWLGGYWEEYCDVASYVGNNDVIYEVNTINGTTSMDNVLKAYIRGYTIYFIGNNYSPMAVTISSFNLVLHRASMKA